MSCLSYFKNKKIFFCGIGGIGTSAIAGFLFDYNILGLKIFGSNNYINENTKRLSKKGIKIFIEHNAKNITSDIDYFVHTEAISLNENPEVLQAKSLNLKILSRGEFLTEISNTFEYNINISGAHGKTTTTGMIAQMLDFLHLKPAIICGGLIKNYKSNYKVGEKYFVKEADESNDSFVKLKTHTAVVTNIAPDHLENYNNNIEELYNKFFFFCQNAKNIIICNEYEYCKKIINILKDQKNILSFGLSDDADVYAQNIIYKKNFITFDVFYLKKCLMKSVKIYMFGSHNILNALATVCVGINLNVDLKLLKKSFSNFKGISNRFDIIKETKNYILINDYAHNPCKIESAINSAVHLKLTNDQFKNYKIIVFFEPHKHSRVHSLMDDFCRSFKLADKVYLLDIYKSYEKCNTLVCKELFKNNINKTSNVETQIIETNEQIIKAEISTLSNAIILFLSAGNYTLANKM